MNYASATTKTVTRVFTESQIPSHLKNEVMRMKKEAAAKAQPKAAPAPAPAPPPKVEVPSPRPEFLEPVSPKTTTSPSKLLQEYQRKNMEEYLQWEIQQPSTYLKQIEFLEHRRSQITKKGKLSASDLDELEEIDDRIEYCEQVLADLEDDYFEDSE